MFKPTPLLRLSICPCGYGILHDNIPLGSIYQVDMDSIQRGGTLVCGGCHKQTSVDLVSVKAGPTNPTYGGLLPVELFQKVN